MGVIKDGAVSGCLPSTKLFSVHYPGYPSSISHAIDTLGGVDKIAKVRTSTSNKLELHFRHEDPYSHPASGQPYPSKNFLLKISRKNHNNCLNGISQTKSSGCEVDNIHPESIGNELKEDKYASGSVKPVEDLTPDNTLSHLSVDIVAQIEEEYHFNGMADYQHVVASHADVAHKRQRMWTEVDNSNEIGVHADADENLMILAPSLFSIKDIPENLVLRPSITLNSKKKLEGVVQHRWEMEIEPCLAIDFSIKEIPQKVSWEAHIPQASNQWEPQMAVSKLFDEQPIWTKNSVKERLGNMGFTFGDNMLKRLLFRVAYYFGSGPFHRLWIRKGYDPRKDPESRIYQRIDFRIPPDMRIHCDTSSGTKHRWEDICSFRVFPSKLQTYLQLCELSDDYIQQEIRKPPILTVCTPATGWFSSHMLNTLRLRIALRFLSVCPLAGAELLRSVSDRFEKSKRMRFQLPNIKPTDGVSQINEEPGVDENKEAANEESGVDEDKEAANEDDEEENEIEDDEAEEDMYAYYPTQLDTEDAFSLQTNTYLDGENMSRNYLQELFGSFPLAGDGNSFHNPESDEEYHIYEQDSDDPGSDY